MAFYNPAQEKPQRQYPAPIMFISAPAMTYQAQATKNYGPHYAREASIGLGVSQIILACLSFTAGIMAQVYGAGKDYLGIGIAGTVIYFISGCLAIAAGKEPKNNLIIATFVFSIFDITCGVAQLIINAIGVSEEEHGGVVFANSLMVGVGSFEIIFGITLTVISARAIDIGSRPQVLSAPIYYTSSVQETVQMGSKSLEHLTYAPTEKTAAYDAVQWTQDTSDEHLYETLHHDKF